ncbi:MAG: hypothetical protein EPN82_02510 [Bacteroidetes bacterium]|nr:MAG: hypothetical protein EPN82_02510 [Bacteroidota bacterium]
MPYKIEIKDIDSFFKNHFDEIPKRDISPDEEKEMINEIMIKSRLLKSQKPGFFSMQARKLKVFTTNIYDGLRIGNIRILSPQFAFPIIFIIGLSVFLILKYSSKTEKSQMIITEKSKIEKQNKEQESYTEKQSQEQDFAKLEVDKEYETISLKAIPLIYSDRSNSQDSSISENKLQNVFLLIRDVLKENGIKAIQSKGKNIITEWVINIDSKKSEELQSRLILNVNKSHNRIVVNIEQKPKENLITKKKNLKNVYKKIDAEVYQLIKLSK